jgi:hypothetical protein
MGELRWGMSPQLVQRTLECKAMKLSSIDPSGSATTGDASFLPAQFLPGPGQQLMLSRDQFAKTFYFFSASKLRKLYIILEPLAYPEGNFTGFIATLQRRFGPGEPQEGELSPDAPRRRWVEWHDATTRLRAIDETNHRGFYSLLFEARAGLHGPGMPVARAAGRRGD